MINITKFSRRRKNQHVIILPQIERNFSKGLSSYLFPKNKLPVKFLKMHNVNVDKPFCCEHSGTKYTHSEENQLMHNALCFAFLYIFYSRNIRQRRPCCVNVDHYVILASKTVTLLFVNATLWESACIRVILQV